MGVYGCVWVSTYAVIVYTHRSRSGRASTRDVHVVAAAASAPRADFPPFSRWATAMESEIAPIMAPMCDMEPTALCKEALKQTFF